MSFKILCNGKYKCLLLGLEADTVPVQDAQDNWLVLQASGDISVAHFLALTRWKYKYKQSTVILNCIVRWNYLVIYKILSILHFLNEF